MRLLFLLCTVSAFLLTACSSVQSAGLMRDEAATFKADFPDSGAYEASPAQLRVDQSFSAIAIDTPFPEVEDQLTPIDNNDCFAHGECSGADALGVIHHFWTDGHDEPWLAVKIIIAKDFDDREISALGIGTARKQNEVVAAARRFLPEVEVKCSRGSVGGQCDGFLAPGWFRITFDAQGNLTEVRFDGYHYT